MLCWKVLLVGLFLGPASAALCDYRDILGTYLNDKSDLYCFDGGEIKVKQGSALCNDANSLTNPRQDDLSVLCADTHKLIGYSKYPCDTATGKLGSAITADALLTPFSACVLTADVATTVCEGANAAGTSDAKLALHPDFNVVDVKLETDPNASNIVHYPLSCADGFDFKADITGLVVGYCTDKTKKDFTLHKDSTSDGCYAMCPANPATLETTPTNMDNVAISKATKSGSVTEAEVNCASGFAIAADAPAKYSFTCTGKKTDAKNQGVYKCTNDCPVCAAKCPAVGVSDAAADNVANAASVANLKAITSAGLAKNGVGKVTVTCEDGFSIAEGAPDKYDVKCTSKDGDASFKGKYELTGTLPECKPKCAQANVVTIDNSKSIVITSDGKFGQSVQGTVVCDTNYAHEDGVDDKHDFVCGDGQASKNGGEFKCKDNKCPACYPECTVPSSNVFEYKLKKDGKAPKGPISKGVGLIEVSCKDNKTQLIGPRFLDCHSDGKLGKPKGQPDPVCEVVDWVCEAPKVKMGRTKTTNNIRVGEKHVVECDPCHWFDVKTAKTYLKDNNTKTMFEQAEITCEKDKKIPEIECYLGCRPPDLSGMVAYPDAKEELGAAYPIGQKVTFSCLDDKTITQGKAEATCDPGACTIPEGVCGACSFAASLLLTFLPLLIVAIF